MHSNFHLHPNAILDDLQIGLLFSWICERYVRAVHGLQELLLLTLSSLLLPHCFVVNHVGCEKGNDDVLL